MLITSAIIDLTNWNKGDLGLFISLVALTISIFSFLRDAPKPIIEDVFFQAIPKRGAFSYRESRYDANESFFYFSAGIMVSFIVINPGGKSIDILDMDLKSDKESIMFTPLLKSTAGNARNDQILWSDSKEKLKKQLVSPLPVYDTLDFSIPAYGSKEVRILFIPNDLSNVHQETSEVQLKWKYAKRRIFWPLFKLLKKSTLKSGNLSCPIDDFDALMRQEIHPEQLLKSTVLHQMSSD